MDTENIEVIEERSGFTPSGHEFHALTVRLKRPITPARFSRKSVPLDEALLKARQNRSVDPEIAEPLTETFGSCLTESYP